MKVARQLAKVCMLSIATFHTLVCSIADDHHQCRGGEIGLARVSWTMRRCVLCVWGGGGGGGVGRGRV